MVDESQDRGRNVHGDRSIEESAVCGTVGGEFDGECVVFPVDREGWYVLLLSCFLFSGSWENGCFFADDGCRIESHGPDYEFIGVFVHGVGGMVGGGQGHWEGYVGGDGVRVGGDSALCAE